MISDVVIGILDAAIVDLERLKKYMDENPYVHAKIDLIITRIRDAEIAAGDPTREEVR